MEIFKQKNAIAVYYYDDMRVLCFDRSVILVWPAWQTPNTITRVFSLNMLQLAGTEHRKLCSTQK